ncbi:hypothetical protein Patl1_21736 [Pistacia atlantica]|uniref:Uncharacterized protein n=1 Tax=Pistacia atlantica TaxID=434234 RepID=A0ACC1BP16_9ROSI|nr:hypothetical protein Patl1_21736 [Pistacia atlantica]
MSSTSLNEKNHAQLLYFQHLMVTTQVANPGIQKAENDDRLLRGWIIGTLAEEALNHVIGLDTSAQVWAALKEALAAIGHMVADKNKVFSLLKGLGARYEPFTTSMLKPPMPSYNEVIPLLQSYETRLNLHSPESSQYTAFYADKNVPKYVPKNPKTTNNFSSKGRGFILANQSNKNFSNGFSSNTSRQENHRDITSLQLNSEAHHEEWTSDTCASAHMTSNEGQVDTTGADEGAQRGNLYAIRAPPVALFSSRFRVALEDIWHQRLGHVQATAVAHLRNKALIRTISNKDNSIYHFTQPAEEAPLPTPNAQLKTTITIEATIVDEDSKATAQQYSGMIAKYGNRSVVKGLRDNSNDLVEEKGKIFEAAGPFGLS